MEFIENFLSPYYIYFRDLYYLLSGVAVLSLLIFIWAYFALVKVMEGRDRDTNVLKNLPRIWIKAKFLPEENRAAESKKIFDQFMAEVNLGTETCPVVIDKGNPRAMKLSEYEKISHIKKVHTISITIFLLSVIYGAVVILANKADVVFGVTVAGIPLVMQIIFMLVMTRLNSRNTKYRRKLFADLEESGSDFFRITRPYILQVNHPEIAPQTASNTEKTFEFEEKGEIPEETLQETKESLEAENGNNETPALTENEQRTEGEEQTATEMTADDSEKLPDTGANPLPNIKEETPENSKEELSDTSTENTLPDTQEEKTPAPALPEEPATETQETETETQTATPTPTQSISEIVPTPAVEPVLTSASQQPTDTPIPTPFTAQEAAFVPNKETPAANAELAAAGEENKPLQQTVTPPAQSLQPPISASPQEQTPQSIPTAPPAQSPQPIVTPPAQATVMPPQTVTQRIVTPQVQSQQPISAAPHQTTVVSAQAVTQRTATPPLQNTPQTSAMPQVRPAAQPNPQQPQPAIPQAPTAAPTYSGFSTLASLAKAREPQGAFSVDSIGDALEQEIANRRQSPPPTV
jgi:hypothetical protein